MINGLFKEISEEEIMSVNGGCGGGINSAGPSPQGKGWVTVSVPPCPECERQGNQFAKNAAIITAGGAVTGGIKGAIVAFITYATTSGPEPHSAHANK